MNSVAAFPLGLSEFESVVTEGFLYIDKTLLIEKIEADPHGVLLFPRPRRFGKTMNLSMLRTFYEPGSLNKARLFQGLAIADRPAFARIATAPVIYFSLKEWVQTCWSDCLTHLTQLFRVEAERQLTLIQQLRPELSPEFPLLDDLVPDRLAGFLCELSEQLTKWHGKKPIVMIDDYDTPITNAQQHHFGTQLLGFLQELFEKLVLQRGMERLILCGSMRIGKEWLFPDPFSLFVSDYQDKNYASFFGLTEAEVMSALDRFQLGNRLEEVRDWYNGYRFGTEEIYSPWSVLLFLKERQLRSHWVEMASLQQAGRLVESTIESRPETFPLFLELFQGGSPEILLGTEQHQGMLTNESLLDLLASSGYLTVESQEADAGRFKLRLANLGIKALAQRLAQVWTACEPSGTQVASMLQILAEGKHELVSEWLRQSYQRGLSFLGPGRQPDRYVFLLGVAALLSCEYSIHAEHDPGHTRFALQIAPHSTALMAHLWIIQPWRPSNLAKERAWVIHRILEEALQQPYWQEYAEQFARRGYPKTALLALLISGKKLWVRTQQEFYPAEAQAEIRGNWVVYQTQAAKSKLEQPHDNQDGLAIFETEDRPLQAGWSELLKCHDALLDLSHEFEAGAAQDYLHALVQELRTLGTERLEHAPVVRKIRRMLDNAMANNYLLGKRVQSGSAISEILVELIRIYDSLAQRTGLIPLE